MRTFVTMDPRERKLFREMQKGTPLLTAMTLSTIGRRRVEELVLDWYGEGWVEWDEQPGRYYARITEKGKEVEVG